MSAYAHGVLTTDTKNNEHTWVVIAREEELAAEHAEDELGPHPFDYRHQIAMLGSRGWKMFQVDSLGGGNHQFWFHRELAPIQAPHGS
jgi:hypothetical protein